MSEEGETPDSHDLDKLTKWHEGLVSESENSFPVCALFLASGEDNRAHDIFRIYRSAFEELGAGFHDLVIFGQHGTTSTCAALIPGLQLSGLTVPSLVLITNNEGLVFHTFGLPEGSLADGQAEDDGASISWRDALEEIKRSMREGSELVLDRVEGLEQVEFSRGTLADIIGEVKLRVEAA